MSCFSFSHTYVVVPSFILPWGGSPDPLRPTHPWLFPQGAGMPPPRHTHLPPRRNQDLQPALIGWVLPRPSTQNEGFCLNQNILIMGCCSRVEGCKETKKGGLILQPESCMREGLGGTEGQAEAGVAERNCRETEKPARVSSGTNIRLSLLISWSQ